MRTGLKRKTTKKSQKRIQPKCQNCGANVTAEICPYCGSITGIKTKAADMEYPTIDCKEAALGFWTVVFPMIFALSFGFFGLVFPIFFVMTGEAPAMVFLMCLPFGAVGIGAFVVMMRPIISFVKVMANGKKISGTVYGYMDDNVLLNGEPAQVVKILVRTKKGPRFLLYQLGRTDHPYGINKRINLRVYKDYFLITKDDKEYDDMW